MLSVFLPLVFVLTLASLPPIVLKGNQLYNSVTKERFYVKGVAYAPNLYANKTAGGTAIDSDKTEDHFTDDKELLWSKDLPLLKDLGINSLRLYNVNPTASHDKFMAAAEAAGLYVVVSTTVPVGEGVLDASKPASLVQGEGCYTTGLVYSAKEIVRAFAKYNNTLAFMVANEIDQYELNGTLLPGYHAIPCVKSLVRDLRAYMKACSCGMRYIPMMYAGTDLKPKNGVNPRDVIAQYLTCGNDAVDLYGVNIYTWCAYASTFSKLSTYKDVTDAFATYDTAIMFSEFGCTYGQFESYYPFTEDVSKPTSQRQWKQIDTLFSKNMSDVFSGGFAYQYSMSEIIYGMVLLPGYSTNSDITLLPNYFAAKRHFTDSRPEVQIADWVETQNLCSWKPQIFSTKIKNICPSSALAQQLFGADELENWSGNRLPPPPSADADLPCPHYTLSRFDKLENECRGSCACDSLSPNPNCAVEWDHLNLTDPIVVENVTRLLGFQCGLLAKYGGAYNNTCTQMNGPGIYFGCRPEEKANFVLDVWFKKVKQETECCANIFSEGPGSCKAVALPPTPQAPTKPGPFCAEIQPQPGCTVDWSRLNFSDATTTANVQRLFDLQCGLLREYGKAFDVEDTCDQFTRLIGRYEACSKEQQANQALGVWFTQVKDSTECCADLFNIGGKCGAPQPIVPTNAPANPTNALSPTQSMPTKSQLSMAPSRPAAGEPEKAQNAFPVVVVAVIGGSVVLLAVVAGVWALCRARKKSELGVEVYAQIN
jgi:hypothetical protein